MGESHNFHQGGRRLGRPSWEEARQSAALLASAHREANGVVHTVTLLKDKLAVVTWDMAETKLLGLADKVVDADWWWEEAER
jgi:hypothetical protein